ncbi:nitrate- and nitrite sensing domain-containing protein [Streptomyces sp. SAI-041]|uniref:nitrate- and nitrite sensing domain-containing protein n=1 Tax=Streptomyces sp. SAI-041 TaxID=2940548 RepID=UPI002473AC7E|nr:nitrate- and nitrite sensing domain-containing protein [Streptomyces sp. SAI-041]MDH6552070.1 PAS domain S-box-containing protein [Streptomyces sp. SAI-041]
MRRSTRRGKPRAPHRIPPLARLRVGRKLTLLVLLPVTALLVLTAFSSAAQWQQARTLRDFRTGTGVAFAVVEVGDAVARERLAAVEVRLRPGPGNRAVRTAAEQATRRVLERAVARTAFWSGSDVAGDLNAVRRQLHSLRARTAAGSLTAPDIAERYGEVEDALLDDATALESGRPTRASGRAADAHLALLRAIEAAERERAEVAALLAGPADRPTGAGRWSALETAQLDAFRENTSADLRTELNALRFQDPGRAVRQVRDLLATARAETVRWPSYERWLADSGARIDALRGIQDRAARQLDATAGQDRRAAETRVVRDLTASLAVLTLVTFLAVALGRSITRPLGEISAGARALSHGDLSHDIRYAGRDEPGEVADALRELRVATERLVAEIRAMNTAIDRNRLEHRADETSFEGAWRQLVGGMNATMASCAAAHGRREEAEQELASVFDLSLDLFCVSGLDGRLKRVNSAFERVLGRSSEELLSRPLIEFVHEEDRTSTREALARLADGAEPAGFENRCLRSDGTEVRLQWSARPVPETGLIHATARDVTDSRRTSREQDALRRVATLVAHGAPPAEVFALVAEEVGDLLDTSAAVLRQEPDGSQTLLGSGLGLPEELEQAMREERRAAERAAIDEVTRTRRAAHIGHAACAPIVVDDRMWGFVLAASPLEVLPAGIEWRLADFTDLVATAIANADSSAQLTASRARVVAQADASRRRTERDLHDGVQQRLVAVRLELRLAETLLTDPTSELAAQLAHVGKGLDDTFQDLLQVARGIHPAILSQGGLGPALRSLARRSPVPVELDLRLPATRLPERVEVAAYYVTSECLNNAAKHAHARVVAVSAEIRDDVLELTVRDDGVGGAEPRRGSGLIGLVDRVEAIGGRLTVGSPPGGGTTVDVRLPLAAPSPDL